MLGAIVIGAGHAGLAASYRLKAAGIDHVVVERGRIGESWRSQRWDSFHLNTVNAMNLLPGMPAPTSPDTFPTAAEFVRSLERYVRAEGLPVHEQALVTGVARDDGGFVVTTPSERLRARHVIVASGGQNSPKVPPAAATLDPAIAQRHAGDYRSADALPPGGVLVVGSAQSGCQIAEDLVDAGRDVFLATGRANRVPRRVRGRDVLLWLAELGWHDQRPADLEDPAMRFAAQAQVSGVGPQGHTLSLQWLASRGVTLLGHLDAADGNRVRLADDLGAHLRAADEGSRRIRELIDRHIAERGLDAPPSAPDPADEPAGDALATAPLTLDLRDRGITSVVWCGGFTLDLPWLRIAERDERGAPRHDEGRAPVSGLWFLGQPWLRTRKSGIVFGARDDSASVVERIAGQA